MNGRCTRARGLWAASSGRGGDTAPTAPYALSSQVCHQSRHGTAGRGYGLTTRLLPDLASPIVPVALGPHTLHVVAKRLILPGTLTALLRLLVCSGRLLKGLATAAGGQCNRQRLAARLDTVCGAVRANKIHPHPGLRSSPAQAKKAAAFCKISWARLSARCARSSAFMRLD